jgi:hypothetical protein
MSFLFGNPNDAIQVAIGGALIDAGLSFTTISSPHTEASGTESTRIFQLTYGFPNKPEPYFVSAYVGGQVLNVFSGLRLTNKGPDRLKEILLHVNSVFAFTRAMASTLPKQENVLWIYAQLPMPHDPSRARDIPAEMLSALFKTVAAAIVVTCMAFPEDMELLSELLPLPTIFVPEEGQLNLAEQSRTPVGTEPEKGPSS